MISACPTQVHLLFLFSTVFCPSLFDSIVVKNVIIGVNGATSPPPEINTVVLRSCKILLQFLQSSSPKNPSIINKLFSLLSSWRKNHIFVQIFRKWADWSKNHMKIIVLIITTIMWNNYKWTKEMFEWIVGNDVSQHNNVASSCNDVFVIELKPAFVLIYYADIHASTFQWNYICVYYVVLVACTAI